MKNHNNQIMYALRAGLPTRCFGRRIFWRYAKKMAIRIVILSVSVFLAVGCSTANRIPSVEIGYSEFHGIRCSDVQFNVCVIGSIGVSNHKLEEIIGLVRNRTNEKVQSVKLTNTNEITVTVGSYRRVGNIGTDGSEVYYLYTLQSGQWLFKEKQEGPLYCLG